MLNESFLWTRVPLENLIDPKIVKKLHMFNVPQVSLSCLQESFTCPCPEPEESNPHHPILSDPLLMLYQVSMYGNCGGQRDIDRSFSLSTLVFPCQYHPTNKPYSFTHHFPVPHNLRNYQCH